MLKWLKRQRTFLESREQSRRRAEIRQGANVKKHLEIPWFCQQQQIEAKENKDLSFQSTLLSLCGLSIVKKRAELLSPFSIVMLLGEINFILKGHLCLIQEGQNGRSHY